MIIIPAIDLKNGQVVRLYKGRFHEVTYYPFSPVAAAEKWRHQGAKRLHIVDLDGAQTGVLHNSSIIREVVRKLDIPVQVGGGIRDMESIDAILDLGVDRVVLGTKAIEDQDFIAKVLARWQDKIIVSVDCANGFVTQRGWTSTSNVKGVDLAKKLQQQGLRTLVYTDIARDGTLQGPNFSAVEEMLQSVTIDVIASGGISCLDDIKRYKQMTYKNLMGVITGKAIYEGKLDFKEAVSL